MGITRIRPGLQMQDGSINSNKLADSSVTPLKIAGTIAGDGLIRDGLTGIVDISLDAAGLEILSDKIFLKSNVTLGGNAFNGPNEFVRLLGDGKLPVLDGSNLTNIAPLEAIASSDLTDLEGAVNTASGAVKLDGSGKLPAIDGSALTNLPGGGGGAWTKITEQSVTVDAQNFTVISGLNIDTDKIYKLYITTTKSTVSQANLGGAAATKIHFNGDNTDTNYRTASSRADTVEQNIFGAFPVIGDVAIGPVDSHLIEATIMRAPDGTVGVISQCTATSLTTPAKLAMGVYAVQWNIIANLTSLRVDSFWGMGVGSRLSLFKAS